MTNTNLKQYTPPPYIHSIAGGVGGAIGAIVTNPLEVSLILLFVGENTIYHFKVVKTRLQSSSKKTVKNISGRKGDYMLKNIKVIIASEGKFALFKVSYNDSI